MKEKKVGSLNWCSMPSCFQTQEEHQPHYHDYSCMMWSTPSSLPCGGNTGVCGGVLGCLPFQHCTVDGASLESQQLPVS